MKLTDYLAIYAAVVSTAAFLWNVMHSRPRIRVDLLYAVEDGQSGIIIVVRNLSPHDVHLAAMDLMYRYKKTRVRDYIADMRRFRSLPHQLGWVHTSLSLIHIDSGLPIKLEARKAHTVFLPNAVIERLLAGAVDRQLKAHVQDQLWKDVYSDALEMPVPTRALEPGPAFE
jgi:hypothetical protein